MKQTKFFAYPFPPLVFSLAAAALMSAACANHVTPPPDGPPPPMENRLEGSWKIINPLTPEEEEAGVPAALQFETVRDHDTVVRHFSFCGLRAQSTASFTVTRGVITSDGDRDQGPKFNATITNINQDSLELDGRYRYRRIQSNHRISVHEKSQEFCPYGPDSEPTLEPQAPPIEAPVPPAPRRRPPPNKRHPILKESKA